MAKIAPSILAADFANLGAAIRNIEKAAADYVHIDVMDGKFVPSISFGMPVIESMRKVTKMVFDVHLMIEEPQRYIADFVYAGADFVTVHAEACTHLHRTIALIKDMGIKAGVALNPATSLEVLDYILPDLDLVLIMSVNPGFGGQKFIPAALKKLRDLTVKLESLACKPEVSVDGGITLQNVSGVLDAGANVIVAGSSVFRGDIMSNIKAFKDIFN